MKSFVCLLLLLSAMVCQPGLSQPTLRFEHLSTQNGLSHNQLFSICEDREGFMWFGTADGLNRYDGYTFTVYKPDPGDPNNHMGHNMVWDIIETRAGQIWFATPGEGLHHIDKRTGKINFFRLDPTRQWLRNICYTLTEDRQGFLWVGSEGGLSRFDPRKKQFRLYEMPGNGTEKRIWSVLEDRFGTLWVGTSDGLFTLDRRTNAFSKFLLDAAHPQQPHIIESIYQSSDNSLWVASKDDALYRLTPTRNSQSGGKGGSVTYQTARQTYLNGSEILPNALAEAADHTLLVGTSRGLIQLNPMTGAVVVHQSNPSVIGSLSHNFVWALLADRRGTFWVGTTNGISRFSTLTPKFSLYQTVQDRTATPRQENNISSLSANKQGAIWFSNSVTLYQDGLFCLDRRTNRLTKHSLKLTNPGRQVNRANSNYITAIHNDRRGRRWVATPEGLHEVTATDQATLYPTRFMIVAIAEDKQGNVWVGGQDCIAKFDPKTKQYTHYCNDPNNPNSLNGRSVNDLIVSRDGMIWVAVGGAGVCKLNPATGRFTSYAPRYTDKEKILFRRDVQALCETSDGAIWVTTNIGGLFRIDPKTDAITTFTTRNGLPDNHVMALLTDQAGMLWLTTSKELCRFNPITKQIRVFDERDGLPSRGFTKAHTREPNGEMVFGSTNGFLVFQPAQMTNNPYKPPVYITQATVSDSVHLFPQSPLNLSYQQNVIAFSFTGLNYIAPEKTQYAYQLVGVNEDWVYCGSERTATYSFLTPGEYDFRVKAANNDGVWNETGTTIHLVISPPWWRTWWAYAAYVLLLLLAVWGLIHYRSYQLLRTNQLLEKKVTLRTEEVIHQKQEIERQRNHLADALTELKDTQAQLIQKEKLASLGELTAGIAHEIQNPLNFVTNFAQLSADLVSEFEEERQKPIPDLALEEDLLTDLKSNLTRISTHGSRAASIIKGMLEHSRTSDGERRPTDLNALADEYLRLAYHGQRAKDQTFNVTIKTDFDPEMGRVSLVGQDIGRVLLNIYTNAFYAVQQRREQSSADYQPTVSVSTKCLKNHVEIRVYDNGTGIPTQVQSKIFQPFFTTKPTGQGTGLGLSLSYDIVTQGHGGSLSVVSQEGGGTEFIVSLPLTPLTSSSATTPVSSS